MRPEETMNLEGTIEAIRELHKDTTGACARKPEDMFLMHFRVVLGNAVEYLELFDEMARRFEAARDAVLAEHLAETPGFGREQ